MSQASASSAKPSPATNARSQSAAQPFFGLIDSVIVEEPAEFQFDGAILREHAAAVWTWIARDLASDLIDIETAGSDPAAAQALEVIMPELLTRTRAAVTAAAQSHDLQRRTMTQLGGEEAYRRLPIVLNALKCRALLEKARGFGRATNGIQDDASLANALQAMPLQDAAIAALLMQAAMGQVANPSRLMAAVVRITGAPTEVAITRAGFGPMVEAILAHAQNQLVLLSPMGAFADMDLTCRALDRFHRLARSINGFVELGRNSRWATALGAITKSVSERVEPRIRDVVLDVNHALRKSREGTDRLDSEQVLSALNGLFLLATIRDCRDSLALNAAFDQSWTQVGQALEIHVQRNLDAVRQNPTDDVVSRRLDAAIKMAELRFNAEYADVLRRAKEAVLKKTDS